MNEVFEKEIEHITKRLETLEHTVYGNGHKGLKAELIELKTEIETFKKNRRLASGYPPCCVPEKQDRLARGKLICKIGRQIKWARYAKNTRKSKSRKYSSRRRRRTMFRIRCESMGQRFVVLALEG
ncbi:MAG: hypothetical protein SPF41_09270 [Candidatus Merdousia sp.]|nr:hypothetical protein [Candidatus Merdousia sp.]